MNLLIPEAIDEGSDGGSLLPPAYAKVQRMIETFIFSYDDIKVQLLINGMIQDIVEAILWRLVKNEKINCWGLSTMDWKP